MKNYLKKIAGLSRNEQNRDNWVRMQLEAIPPGSMILDAGCGTQRYRQHCNHLVYRAQDFGKYDGIGSGEGLQTEVWNYGKLDYVGNVWDIRENDNTFDAILCTEVFEHIPYPNETIAEFARLLKPGGLLVITAPFCSLPHMQPFYYYNGYSIDYYRYIFNKYNFDLQVIEPNGNAYDYVAQELFRVVLSTPMNMIKFLGMPLFAIVFFLLRLLSLSAGEEQSYLPFGYHTVARKKTFIGTGVSSP